MLKSLKAHYSPVTVERIKARLADLGFIHEGKDQLGLDEATYRAMVSAASGALVTSSADLDARARAKLIKALKAKGYEPSQVLSERSLKIKQNRLRDLGLIHMGQRQLGLDEKTYRDLVQAASSGKSRTCALLAAPERARLIAQMKALGFEPPEPAAEPERREQALEG